MTPVTKAAIAALTNATLEDPNGLIEALEKDFPEDAREKLQNVVGRAFLNSVESIGKKEGRADAFEEVLGRIVRIAEAYQETDEPKLAAAFAKFGRKLKESWRKEVEAVVSEADGMLKELRKESSRGMN